MREEVPTNLVLPAASLYLLVVRAALRLLDPFTGPKSKEAKARLLVMTMVGFILGEA